MFKDLVIRNRSCRRFREREAVSLETLQELVDLARICPSAANLQPLKYYLSHTPETNARIFPHLAWAGYLEDWEGPEEGQRPAAYIVVLGDTEIWHQFGCDHGIVAQTMLLGAVERGLAGCMIGSVDRDRLAQALHVPDKYRILLVLALGVPAEERVLEETGEMGDIRYYRAEDGIHHVPKRPLREILVNFD